jgi:threonine/homoserine/homoserine lactone efflux protein
MVLGVALIDAAYIALGATGIATLLQVNAARRTLGLTGALVLAAFGVRALLSARPPEKAATAERRKSLGAFATGALLTAGNPLTILFWTGAFASLIAAGRVRGPAEIAAFSAGCIAATLLFLAIAAWAAQRLAPLFRGRAALWLDRAVGVVLIAFAVRLLLAQVG